MSTVGSLNISQQNKDRKDRGIINSPRPLFQFMYESHLRGLHGLLFVFALSLGHSLELSLGTTIQNLLSVFVHFQFDDLHVGSVNADLCKEKREKSKGVFLVSSKTRSFP